MPQNRTRKIVVTGVLGAISVFLGLTRWGFIPLFGLVSITILHIPAIIGAILEGPLVGAIIGLIFGLFSMVQAAVAPGSVADTWFTNPLLSILPRLFIGPVAWIIWKSLSKWPIPGLVLSGIAGSLTNTFLVLAMIGIMGLLPWAVIGTVILTNGLAEAAASALIVLVVVTAWKQIDIGSRRGAKLD